MSQGIDMTSSSKLSSSADDSFPQFNAAASQRCFPLPLTTQPLPRDVTVTSSQPRAVWLADRATSPLSARPQRISLALTMRQLAPTSDDVTIGDVTRRDVSWRPCSVSLMASSIGNVRVSSMMRSWQPVRLDTLTSGHWPRSNCCCYRRHGRINAAPVRRALRMTNVPVPRVEWTQLRYAVRPIASLTAALSRPIARIPDPTGELTAGGRDITRRIIRLAGLKRTLDRQ